MAPKWTEQNYNIINYINTHTIERVSDNHIRIHIKLLYYASIPRQR